MQTTEEFASSPEKRSLIGREIVASEIEYMRTLSIVKNEFYVPLRSALDSNRYIFTFVNINRSRRNYTLHSLCQNYESGTIYMHTNDQDLLI